MSSRGQHLRPQHAHSRRDAGRTRAALRIRRRGGVSSSRPRPGLEPGARRLQGRRRGGVRPRRRACVLRGARLPPGGRCRGVWPRSGRLAAVARAAHRPAGHAARRLGEEPRRRPPRPQPQPRRRRRRRRRRQRRRQHRGGRPQQDQQDQEEDQEEAEEGQAAQAAGADRDPGAGQGADGGAAAARRARPQGVERAAAGLRLVRAVAGARRVAALPEAVLRPTGRARHHGGRRPRRRPRHPRLGRAVAGLPRLPTHQALTASSATHPLSLSDG